MVCEESNDDARRDVTVEFREQERVLGANFQQIALRLKAMQTKHSAMSMRRDETRQNGRTREAHAALRDGDAVSGDIVGRHRRN